MIRYDEVLVENVDRVIAFVRVLALRLSCRPVITLVLVT